MISLRTILVRFGPVALWVWTLCELAAAWPVLDAVRAGARLPPSFTLPIFLFSAVMATGQCLVLHFALRRTLPGKRPA